MDPEPARKANYSLEAYTKGSERQLRGAAMVILGASTRAKNVTGAAIVSYASDPNMILVVV